MKSKHDADLDQLRRISEDINHQMDAHTNEAKISLEMLKFKSSYVTRADLYIVSFVMFFTIIVTSIALLLAL